VLIAAKVETYIEKLQGLIRPPALAQQPDDEQAVASPTRTLPHENSGDTINSSSDTLSPREAGNKPAELFPKTAIPTTRVEDNDVPDEARTMPAEFLLGKLLTSRDLQVYNRIKPKRVVVLGDLDLSNESTLKKSLRNFDLSGFIFTGKVNAQGCDLSDSNFSDCEFQSDFIVDGANLSGVKFKNTKFFEDYHSDTKTNFGKGKKRSFLGERTEYKLVAVDAIPETSKRQGAEKAESKECLFVKKNATEVNWADNLEYATADMNESALIALEGFNQNLLSDLHSEKNKEHALRRILMITDKCGHTKAPYIKKMTRVFPIGKTGKTFSITTLLPNQEQKSSYNENENALTIATYNNDEAKTVWDDIHREFNVQKNSWRNPSQFFSDLWNGNIIARLNKKHNKEIKRIKVTENGKEVTREIGGICYADQINAFLNHTQQHPKGRAANALLRVMENYQVNVFEHMAKTKITSAIAMDNDSEFAESVRVFRSGEKPILSRQLSATENASNALADTQRPVLEPITGSQEAAPEKPADITSLIEAAKTEAEQFCRNDKQIELNRPHFRKLLQQNSFANNTPEIQVAASEITNDIIRHTRVLLAVLPAFREMPSTTEMASLDKLKDCIDKLKLIKPNQGNPSFYPLPELDDITYNGMLNAITNKYNEIRLALANQLVHAAVHEASLFSENLEALENRLFYTELVKFNECHNTSAQSDILLACQGFQTAASDHAIKMTRALLTVFSDNRTAEERNNALIHLKNNIGSDFYWLNKFQKDSILHKIFLSESKNKLTDGVFKKICRQAYSVGKLEDALTGCLVQPSTYDHVKILITSNENEFRVQAAFLEKFLNPQKTKEELEHEQEKIKFMGEFLGVIQTQIQAMHADATTVSDAIAEIQKGLAPIKLKMENTLRPGILSSFGHHCEHAILSKIKTIEEAIQDWKESTNKVITLPVSDVAVHHRETHEPVFN